ncbi:DUF1801 domain-containing protein [Kineococcus rhizosphaerae]|uniref:DUF1801 domain-containing protein n=1 Tax=Kineococcus rhizosphaerae TaxID=559628 RepID=UPI000D049CA7|nr:DUF1801 domain-containing protein [Kineococcus rhizosphaerae]
MPDNGKTPAQNIDELVERSAGWRGEVLAQCRRTILSVDDGIVEEWKYMGAPVWDRYGTLVVGGVFKAKVKMGFLWGASLADPKGLFNGELGGNQRRSVEFAEGDTVDTEGFADLVREAVRHNAAKKKK